jgi:hypothetical protein
MLHKDYGREPRGAWRQGEPIGGKPTVVKRVSPLLRSGTVQEPRGSETSAVRSRYHATASEDIMGPVVTVTFGVCNSVRLS